MTIGLDLRWLESSSLRCAAARRRVVSMSHRANSAHLGSSLSVIEILDVIYSLARICPENARTTHRDRVVFSKGHAAMGYYATLENFGLVDPTYLDTYLADGTKLWGHVSMCPDVPAIDASTGSLGHGLSLATGYALSAVLNGKPELQTYCVLSDGECNEGSIWEAAMFAGARKLDKLTVIVDYNHIQSLAPTATVMDLEPFAGKWRAFGWDTFEVDGHDVSALCQAIGAPRAGQSQTGQSQTGQPRAILAHTIKGRGIARIENTVASHYKPALANDLSEMACATAS
jgi:transketolase